MKNYKFIQQAIQEGYCARTNGDIIGKRGHVLSYSISKGGYKLIGLFVDKFKKQKTVTAHQVVWVYFKKTPCKNINHINGIKIDNNIQNLESSNSFKQMQHAYATGLMRDMRGDRAGLNKISKATVSIIRKKHAEGAKQKDLSIEYAISKAQVCRIVNYKCWDYSSKLVRKRTDELHSIN